jgi:hypothetical protein
VESTAPSRRVAKPALSRNASDDDILGLGTAATHASERGRDGDLDAQLAFDFDADLERDTDIDTAAGLPQDAINGEPENLRAVFDSNPELRKDWQDAHAYRESFATPEDARNATTMLADLNHMDALFFSRRPEDHAELARSIARLDPGAFASLAKAMGAQAMTPLSPVGAQHPPAPLGRGAVPAGPAGRPGAGQPRISHMQGQINESGAGATEEPALRTRELNHQQIPRRPESGLARDDNAVPVGPSAAQTEFFHSTNAAAVENVLDAIESQVERLLPDGVSKNARNRVVGEIYRELDVALRSNRQLAQQMRDAFRSGSLDAEHQRAIVSMIAGRARQALPGVAKRVLSEWTSTVVAANQDRRARQRAAERRVDIAGSRGGGGEAHRATSPRDVDYARMSDADILNL